MAEVNYPSLRLGVYRGLARATENGFIVDPAPEVEQESDEVAHEVISEWPEELPVGFQSLAAEMVTTSVAARGRAGAREIRMAEVRDRARDILRALKEWIDGDAWNPDYTR